MKLSAQSHASIASSLREAVDKYIADGERTVVTDPVRVINIFAIVCAPFALKKRVHLNLICCLIITFISRNSVLFPLICIV